MINQLGSRLAPCAVRGLAPLGTALSRSSLPFRSPLPTPPTHASVHHVAARAFCTAMVLRVPSFSTNPPLTWTIGSEEGALQKEIESARKRLVNLREQLMEAEKEEARNPKDAKIPSTRGEMTAVQTLQFQIKKEEDLIQDRQSKLNELRK